MKYLTPICIFLLAVVIIFQIRISDRLNEIAKRPISSSLQSGPGYVPRMPTAAEIAGAIRSQEAADAPSKFYFVFSNSGGTSTYTGPIRQVLGFHLTRYGGRSTNLKFELPPDVDCQLTPPEMGFENGCAIDRYQAIFTFGRSACPVTNWQFSLGYLDKNGQSAERKFAGTFYPPDKAGFPHSPPYEIVEVSK